MSRWIATGVAAALASLQLSCGAGQTTGQTAEAQPQMIEETQVGEKIVEPPEAPPVSQEQTSSRQPTPSGEQSGLTRAALDEVLAAGPAALLGMVETAPVQQRGQFVGFKIVAFKDGPPTVIDLRVGDVLLAVNGRRIERPGDYFEVFQALQTAEVLQLVVLRGARQQVLDYPIVE